MVEEQYKVMIGFLKIFFKKTSLNSCKVAKIWYVVYLNTENNLIETVPKYQEGSNLGVIMFTTV